MRGNDMDRAALTDLLAATIRDVAGIAIPKERYGDDLFRLGLDSVKAIEIVNRMEDALDLLVDDADLRKFVSIEAIADHFEGLRRA